MVALFKKLFCTLCALVLCVRIPVYAHNLKDIIEVHTGLRAVSGLLPTLCHEKLHADTLHEYAGKREYRKLKVYRSTLLMNGVCSVALEKPMFIAKDPSLLNIQMDNGEEVVFGEYLVIGAWVDRKTGITIFGEGYVVLWASVDGVGYF